MPPRTMADSSPRCSIPPNLASGVWADTAYRSAANLALLDRHGLVAQFQRAKPRGKPMPAHVRRGNLTRAKVRAQVEHVFAPQKRRLGLIVRTIGLARATTKIILANLTYNMRRLARFEDKTLPAIALQPRDAQICLQTAARCASPAPKIALSRLNAPRKPTLFEVSACMMSKQAGNVRRRKIEPIQTANTFCTCKRENPLKSVRDTSLSDVDASHT